MKKKHIVQMFTVRMPLKMAKEVRKNFDSELKNMVGFPSYMLAIQPLAKAGQLNVAIISPEFGAKLKKLIDKELNRK